MDLKLLKFPITVLTEPFTLIKLNISNVIPWILEEGHAPPSLKILKVWAEASRPTWGSTSLRQSTHV
jgi:hypothetical protein